MQSAQLEFSDRILAFKPKPRHLPFSDLKEDFLKSMRSRKGYKRYLCSPLRYAGGKSLAACQIIRLFPDKISQRVTSLFFGGGSIEIALNKEMEREVIGYDLFDILVNYWKVQIHHPEELYLKLKKFSPDKIFYEKIKTRLKKHWLKESRLPPMDLAAHYFFNHNLSYGPGFLGWMSKIYENRGKYQRAIEKVKNFKCRGLTVRQGSFEKTALSHREDFLYLDPPYFLEGDSKMFRGIYPQRNFPIHHKGFNHTLLRDILLKHKGKFVLSYNDCSQVRKLYKGFDIEKVKWQYTLGQGETRIGLNRIQRNMDHVKKSHEILIIKG